MKKVLFLGMVFGALALTSCKKNYKCTYGDGDTQVVKKHNALTNKEAKKKKDDCENGALKGEWSLNL